MANPHRGEVAFDAAGRRHTIRFDTNAICSLEDELGMGFGEIAAHAARVHVSTIRAALRAGLGGDGTIDEAGAIIDEIGLRQAVTLLTEAFIRAYPREDDKTRRSRPQRGGAAGTGATS